MTLNSVTVAWLTFLIPPTAYGRPEHGEQPVPAPDRFNPAQAKSAATPKPDRTVSWRGKFLITCKSFSATQSVPAPLVNPRPRNRPRNRKPGFRSIVDRNPFVFDLPFGPAIEKFER